jgi:hypothetical protein
MSPAEQLAKALASHLEEDAEAKGDFFVDHGDGKIGHDGIIDLVKLAEIAIDFEPEEEPLPDFDCPECGGHNLHEPGCIRGMSPVDTGALKRTLSIRTPK